MSTIESKITGSASSEGHASSHPELANRITKIRPALRWQWLNVRELWQYRELFVFLTWRDIKVRYKQTVIGAGWAILQPLLMMVVFTVFLGRLGGFGGGDIPYPVFVFSGLVPWTFFATAVSHAGNSVVGSEKLITKIYFPRLIIPVAAIGTALVDALIASLLMILMLVGTGSYPSINWLLAPILLLTISIAAIGVGTWLAALNVAYRDFRYVIPFLIQLWLFATPSVYMQVSDSRNQVTKGRVNDVLETVCTINPMTGLIDSFRCALTGHPIDVGTLAIALVVSLLLLVSGCLYFRRVEHRFADIV